MEQRDAKKKRLNDFRIELLFWLQPADEWKKYLMLHRSFYIAWCFTCKFLLKTKKKQFSESNTMHLVSCERGDYFSHVKIKYWPCTPSG